MLASGLTAHELRHTVASLAPSAGANVKAASACSTRQRADDLAVYSGLFDADLDGVAERLNPAASL